MEFLTAKFNFKKSLVMMMIQYCYGCSLMPSAVYQVSGHGQNQEIHDGKSANDSQSRQTTQMLTNSVIAQENLKIQSDSYYHSFINSKPDSHKALRAVKSLAVSLQFMGEVSTFEKMAEIDKRLETLKGSTHGTYVRAIIAGSRHEFSQALNLLGEAADMGYPEGKLAEQRKAIQLARGENLPSIKSHYQTGTQNIGRAILLAATHIEEGDFESADEVYIAAINSYNDASPLGIGWVYFLRGVLHGEIWQDGDRDTAQESYEHALAYLPFYVKAAIHLSEILVGKGEVGRAHRLLLTVASTEDPEIHSALAETYTLMGDSQTAQEEVVLARAGYEKLLESESLAFADHAAEFFAADGARPAYATELIELDLSNRQSAKTYGQYIDMMETLGTPKRVCEKKQDFYRSTRKDEGWLQIAREFKRICG
jgi:tetratricopeptide (TPR) repeat protein